MLRWFWVGMVLLFFWGVAVAISDEPEHPRNGPQVYPVLSDADDGTEFNVRDWHPDGLAGSDRNWMGRTGAQRFDLAMRFSLDDVQQGDSFVYARLVLPGTAEGSVLTEALLKISGVNRDGCPTFSTTRPSLLPKTVAKVNWVVAKNWPGIEQDEDPEDPEEEESPPDVVSRNTPNLATIINEILARPGWGSGEYGRTVGLVLDGSLTAAENRLVVRDYDDSSPTYPVMPQLELYPSVYSTFVAKEMLGRPTDTSVTISALSLLPVEVYAEYGLAPGSYLFQTPVAQFDAEEPIRVTLTGLQAGKKHFYRLRFRRAGVGVYDASVEHAFYTQRTPSKTFRFTVISDSHIWEAYRQGTNPALYARALQNVALDSPDFHVDLGDTFMCEDYTGGNARDLEDAIFRCLAQRRHLEAICHSIPFFSVLGNHEGEQGWRLDGTSDNLAIRAATARKLLIANPVPDLFYSGCETEIEHVGLPENYYAFEWGPALFVMIDPYWYTMTKPHGAGGPGSGDNWDWTLGLEQYEWLRDTLAGSDATHKLVFAHQVTGGINTYGRGGIEAASHALGGAGSFEWGGEDTAGRYVFDRKRPGWDMPIHDLMVEHDVDIFFHGHDHVFAREVLDGIVYQECPQPSNRLYGSGQHTYPLAQKVNNSGHLRVTVSPAQVKVEYVRAYLPGDGLNGKVSFSYVVVAD